MVLFTPKVMHVLANSVPDLNGYAIRSHDLLVSLNEAGICEPVVLTSPYYPDREAMWDDALIDGIKYNRSTLQSAKSTVKKNTGFNVSKTQPLVIRLPKYAAYKSKLLFKILTRPVYKRVTMFLRFLGEKRMMKRFEKEIISFAILHKPDIIHAHTPFRVGLPALRASRKLGIPFIYEVRGMWEDSAVAQGRWTPKSIPYRYYRNQENKVIKLADDVIVIGENLMKEITGRNLRSIRPTMIPNAIGRDMATYPLEFEHTPLESVTELTHRLSLEESTIVVGYIGSLRALEGVDFTAKAVAKCARAGLDIRFLVCSSKSNQDQLRNLCSDLGIEAQSFIEGPYPHDEIVQFYDLIDIFVVSRPDSNVTRIVPPIKPLEAMIRQLPTVVSDLPALCEIIEHRKTGMTFPAQDIQALSSVIQELASNPSLREEIGQSARNYVLKERTWPDIVHSYNEIYQRI
jgi:glycosyltransferase involved in cell wall biosynthesis